jgi:hypothetical protein
MWRMMRRNLKIPTSTNDSRLATLAIPNNMEPLQPPKWDYEEFFTSASGDQLVRHATSDANGVCLECSMDDEIIGRLVSPEVILKMRLFPANNANVEPISTGGFMAVLKLGESGDQNGNFILLKVRTVPGFDPSQYSEIVFFVLRVIEAYGIRLDKNVVDTIRGN